MGKGRSEGANLLSANSYLLATPILILILIPCLPPAPSRFQLISQMEVYGSKLEPGFIFILILILIHPCLAVKDGTAETFALRHGFP